MVTCVEVYIVSRHGNSAVLRVAGTDRTHALKYSFVVVLPMVNVGDDPSSLFYRWIFDKDTSPFNPQAETETNSETETHKGTKTETKDTDKFKDSDKFRHRDRD